MEDREEKIASVSDAIEQGLQVWPLPWQPALHNGALQQGGINHVRPPCLPCQLPTEWQGHCVSFLVDLPSSSTRKCTCMHIHAPTPTCTRAHTHTPRTFSKTFALTPHSLAAAGRHCGRGQAARWGARGCGCPGAVGHQGLGHDRWAVSCGAPVVTPRVQVPATNAVLGMPQGASLVAGHACLVQGITLSLQAPPSRFAALETGFSGLTWLT